MRVGMRTMIFVLAASLAACGGTSGSGSPSAAPVISNRPPRDGGAGDAPAGPPKWLTDPDKALSDAGAQHRPVLIEFFADWAMPCHELDKELLDPDVERLVGEHYVAARIDVTDGSDSARQLQDRFHADAVPTLLVLDASGHELARRVGLARRAELLDLLGRVLH